MTPLSISRPVLSRSALRGHVLFSFLRDGCGCRGRHFSPTFSLFSFFFSCLYYPLLFYGFSTRLYSRVTLVLGSLSLLASTRFPLRERLSVFTCRVASTSGEMGRRGKNCVIPLMTFLFYNGTSSRALLSLLLLFILFFFLFSLVRRGNETSAAKILRCWSCKIRSVYIAVFMHESKKYKWEALRSWSLVKYSKRRIKCCIVGYAGMLFLEFD